MSAQWQKKWRRKSEKQKNQIVLVVVLMVVGAYALAVFQFSFAEHKKTINLYNRQMDRLTKKKEKAPAKVPDTASLAKQLKTIQGQINAAKTTREKLGGSFVSLEEPAEMRKLRFALTTMASEAGLDIKHIVDAGLVRTDNKSAPIAGEMENVTNNAYGRPLIRIRAESSYSGLMRFFQDLHSLSYKVVVVRYGVFVREQKQNISPDMMLEVSKSQKQPLQVSLLLAL